MLNEVFASAATAGQIVYLDAGDYLVSNTIYSKQSLVCRISPIAGSLPLGG